MSAPVVVDLDALEEVAALPESSETDQDAQAPRLPLLRVVGLVGSAAFAGAMSLTCFVC